MSSMQVSKRLVNYLYAVGPPLDHSSARPLYSVLVIPTYTPQLSEMAPLPALECDTTASLTVSRRTRCWGSIRVASVADSPKAAASNWSMSERKTEKRTGRLLAAERSDVEEEEVA